MEKRMRCWRIPGSAVRYSIMGIILFFAFFCLPAVVSGAVEKNDTFTENGIEYSITSVEKGRETVSVRNGQSFTGNELPDHVDYEGVSYQVTDISSRAFIGNESLALTSLPAGITSIGMSAFSGCTNLALTSLPDGVKYVSANTFKDCVSLSLDSMPSGISGIGDYAFSGCTNLALSAVPDGVTSIGRSAFYNCTGLTEMTLPDSVEQIGQGAFGNCRNWKLAKLPDNLQSIQPSAFENCESLCITAIPANVASIGDYAFYNCIGLKRLSMSDGVQTIGFEAFRGCANLSWIRLSDTITSIDSQAFSRCLSLEWVRLPSALLRLPDGLFDYCSNLNYVVLGDNIQEIDKGAFDTYQPHVVYSGTDTATSSALDAASGPPFYAKPVLTWDGSGSGLGSGDNYISRDLSVSESIIIQKGNTLTVTAGAHLTITGNFTVEEGAEVILENGAVLTVNGTLDNYGVITNDGTIENVGALNNYGTIHSYQGVVEGNAVSGNAPLESQIVVTPYSGTFDAMPHPGADVSGVADDETLSYSTNYSKYYLSNPELVTWSDTMPEYTTVEDAKEPLTVKAERAGHTVAIISVNVIIRKTKAEIVTYPLSSPILEGDILEKSALIGGKAVVAGTDIELEGSFFWGSIERNSVPKLSDSGVTEFDAYFWSSEFSTQNIDISTFYLTVEVIECTHDGTGRETVVTEATCGHTGENRVICTQCKDALEVITLPLKEHTWDEGEVTTPASVTAAGVRTYTCDVCGAIRTEEIPKLPDIAPEPGNTENPGMTPEPGATEIPGTTPEPGATENPGITPEPGETEPPGAAADSSGSAKPGTASGQNSGISNGSGSAGENSGSGISNVNLKKGMSIRDKKTNGIYIVTKVTAAGGMVTYKKPIKRKANIKIPDKIQYKNVVLKVTAVKGKAFYKNSKIKKCTIGKNIKTIGSKAFYGCKKLSCVKIKSRKLGKAGKKAFTRMGSKAKRIKIYVPKKCVKKYKKLFRKRGLVSRAVFRIG